MSSKEKIEELKKLKLGCFNCKSCGLSYNIIDEIDPHCFGVGNVSARIMAVAEAPGFNETVKKKPLVGQAGNNFDKYLEEIGLQRKEIYISNVVKCRPVVMGKNRAPTSAEINCCKKFLIKEVSIIQPHLIISLGNHSLEFFTGHQGISNCHGRMEISKEFNVLIFPIFHPSPFNVKNPERKEKIKQDLLILKNIIDENGLRIETHN